MSLKVLILGGYGTFGGRLAHLLADESRLTLVIAGRSEAKARAFCAGMNASAQLRVAAFDRDGDVERQLAALMPDVLVDASGPFQVYGDPYKVVRACLAVGINYLDLADGSDFVSGITQFDAEAKARNLFVLSGVSSFPVLTAAVIRRLARGMSRLDAVSAGIAPSPYAGVGLNVIRAIASYAGRPVSTAESVPCHALTDVRYYTVAPPGRVPLRPVRFSLVDVPDLQVLPKLWPSLRSVWVGAGPVPEILHRALNALAWTVRLKLLRSLLPFAPLMYRAINVLRWGEHRGGMFVALDGADERGRAIARSWHMVAEADDGPLVPSMAAEAVVRRRLEGRSPAAGARAATGDLELVDYEALFARRRIFTGVRVPIAADAPLYRRILGDAWGELPKPVQAMHDGTTAAAGLAVVERGTGILSRLIGALFGFPAAGRHIPLTVTFQRQGATEIWQRKFGARSFTSIQEEGQGSFDRLLCERFGPFAFGLALVIRGGRLDLVVRGWQFLGIPLPLALAPAGEAFEAADDGRFRFHVEIAHRWIGLIVRYRGVLDPTRT